MKALVLAVGALLLMAATAFAGPHYAAARWRTDAKICQYYGFPPAYARFLSVHFERTALLEHRALRRLELRQHPQAVLQYHS